jgi:hypothetical protein
MSDFIFYGLTGKQAQRAKPFHVSILKLIATQPSGIRWDFKAKFKVYQGKVSFTIFVSA